MDNHLHLLLRVDPEVANAWSDSEVVEHWLRLFPPRGSDRKPMKISEELVALRMRFGWMVLASDCRRLVGL